MICFGVPCIANETTAMTAKSASQSPNRLTICAYQTRRITSMRRTSRKVIAAGGAAADAVDIWVLHGLGRERRAKLAVGLKQQSTNSIPIGSTRLRVAQCRGLRAQQRRRLDARARRLVQDRVFVGDEPADLLRAVLPSDAARHPPRELRACDCAWIELRVRPRLRLRVCGFEVRQHDVVPAAQ